MFNRSAYKSKAAAQYLARKWMKGDNKSSIPLLDLYESYKDWLIDNANGCDLEVANFTKKIKEVFPDATVKDGAVKGIVPYARPPDPKPIKKTQLERDIEWVLYYASHNHPNLEYHGFTVEYILKEVSYHADATQITEDQLTDYLTKSDMYFQHPTKKYWLKEWRG